MVLRLSIQGYACLRTKLAAVEDTERERLVHPLYPSRNSPRLSCILVNAQARSSGTKPPSNDSWLPLARCGWNCLLWVSEETGLTNTIVNEAPLDSIMTTVGLRA